MLRFIKLLLVLFVVLVAASFTLLNDQNVVLNYYLAERELPLAWVIFFSLSAGWLLGLISVAGWIIGLRWRLREAERKAELAETEVRNLRRMPLSDSF
ncbi:MAG: LapA family protein [Gammaproteobacteria bacterium]|nr:LapA family protein [Gammaproteobacteria bacterium]